MRLWFAQPSEKAAGARRFGPKQRLLDKPAYLSVFPGLSEYFAGLGNAAEAMQSIDAVVRCLL